MIKFGISRRASLMMRRVDPDYSPIEVPEAVVQYGGKQHPRDVRQHESPSHVVDTIEDEGGDDDEDPHQADFHESPAQLLRSEEKWRPQPIEKQLHCVDSERNSDFSEPTAFVPHPERSEAHRQVENRPNREEKLKSRLS